MKNTRDDFPKTVREQLAKRVGFICSRPECRTSTSGPNSTEGKATILGEAAHITAAAPGGPRHDKLLSNEQRSSIMNAIWLCSNCATLIDKDANRHPVELLRQWKKEAENAAERNLGKALSHHLPRSALVAIDVHYATIARTQERHEYSLVVNMSCRGSIAPEGTLQIIWPDFLPFRIVGIPERQAITKTTFNDEAYHSISVKTPSLLPDTPHQLLGKQTPIRISYHVDEWIYRDHIRKFSDDKEVLRYRLFLGDHSATEGGLSITALQNF
ncbi:hypothetical protein [Corallococcus exiguus]|uniref:hypothetical protein n=1 Tax=Corallococcus exiguus TaxID=83462 RepID=UPI00156154EB|nr:hypothetical protein [Corallococcus exiguus]NRD51622.1 hypothetical protein [Corallococcus exiguus]